MFLLVFITKHTKTNDTSTSLSFTQHNSYFVKNKIIILFFLFFLLILIAIDKCNRASSLAISVSQHCERAFGTPFICLCAPYMERHSLRCSIEPKEGHKTTGASKNRFNILYVMDRSNCSLKISPRKRPPGLYFFLMRFRHPEILHSDLVLD